MSPNQPFQPEQLVGLRVCRWWQDISRPGRYNLDATEALLRNLSNALSNIHTVPAAGRTAAPTPLCAAPASIILNEPKDGSTAKHDTASPKPSGEGSRTHDLIGGRLSCVAILWQASLQPRRP